MSYSCSGPSPPSSTAKVIVDPQQRRHLPILPYFNTPVESNCSWKDELIPKCLPKQRPLFKNKKVKAHSSNGQAYRGHMIRYNSLCLQIHIYIHYFQPRKIRSNWYLGDFHWNARAPPSYSCQSQKMVQEKGRNLYNPYTCSINCDFDLHRLLLWRADSKPSLQPPIRTSVANTLRYFVQGHRQAEKNDSSSTNRLRWFRDSTVQAVVDPTFLQKWSDSEQEKWFPRKTLVPS